MTFNQDEYNILITFTRSAVKAVAGCSVQGLQQTEGGVRTMIFQIFIHLYSPACFSPSP